MNLELKDRIVLVTGGSKGIGAAIVRAFAREGARVAFCARPSPQLEGLAAELTAAGHRCLALPVDVFAPQSVAAAVASAAAHWGGLDVLVNNVGGAPRFAGFEELTDEDWFRSFEFNVMSVVRFTRAALPHLRQSSLRRIINVSSISALQPGAFNPHYTTTKAAVVNLGKHLANTLAAARILVNTVCPGPIHSDSWQRNVSRVAAARGTDMSDTFAEIEAAEAAKIPLGVVGEAAQVADATVFLASPVSSWTTGSCFHVNGGKLAAAL